MKQVSALLNCAIPALTDAAPNPVQGYVQCKGKVGTPPGSSLGQQRHQKNNKNTGRIIGRTQFYSR